MKRGAINLSINMIIVLIIAIIILGFALSFITGMLRKAEIGLSGQFPEPDVSVSSSHPISIGENFMIRDGEVRRVTLKVFNTKSTGINTYDATTGNSDPPTNPAFDCGQGPEPTVSQIEAKTIDAGDTENIKAVIRGGSGMRNDDICVISFVAEDGSYLNQSFFLDTR